MDAADKLSLKSIDDDIDNIYGKTEDVAPPGLLKASFDKD